MNKIEKFCKEYNDEIIAVGIGFGIGLAIIVGFQAKEISRLNRIWARNDKAYLKLLGENELLGRIINKIV